MTDGTPEERNPRDYRESDDHLPEETQDFPELEPDTDSPAEVEPDPGVLSTPDDDQGNSDLWDRQPAPPTIQNVIADNPEG